MDIRGWNEMHPLNGPAWSLFLEYIANILHALVLRKLSKTVLFILVIAAGAALIHMAVTSPNGDIIGGWSLEAEQIRIGFTRLMFPYMAGMLLRRMVKVGSGKNNFIWCSLLLIAVLSFPRIGGYGNPWANGLYDSLAVIIVFPILIYWGSTGTVKNQITERICSFLGDISYPIYILHFPLGYLFYAWVTENNIPIEKGILVGSALFILSILLSYATLKLYDEPVRKKLAEKFLRKNKTLKK